MITHPYLLTPVDLSQVVQSIRTPKSENIAPLILAVAPCRSGSTALLRVFGASGVQAHFQPLKNILRWAMQGQAWEWKFPTGNQPIFIKETIGPYTLEEATFNPFEVLQAIGYPMSALKVMIVGREPVDTWNSWRANFGRNTRLEIMVAAYRQVEIIRKQVLAAGIPLSYFVYEAVRDFGPEATIRTLFDQLELKYTRLAIEGWENLPAYGEEGSNIVCDTEPTPFIVPHIHDRVEQASHLCYYDSNGLSFHSTPEELEQIKASELEVIYSSWREQLYSQLQQENKL